MADETQEPQISQAALERWQSIAQETPVRLSLTRGDLDNLMLALRNMAIGQSELVAALSAHTNQDLNGCVDAMMRASALSRAAFERVTALIAAVMASAEPEAIG